MACQILHTQDSEDGGDRERRTWHRWSVPAAVAFANTLPVGGNRRGRVKIVDLDTNTVVRDDEPLKE